MRLSIVRKHLHGNRRESSESSRTPLDFDSPDLVDAGLGAISYSVLLWMVAKSVRTTLKLWLKSLVVGIYRGNHHSMVSQV